MSRRTALAMVALALVLAAALGASGAWLASRGGDDPPQLAGPASRGALALPGGQVEVVAETVTLGAGFTSRHRHGGPTFNIVRSGEVEIADVEGRRRLGAGEFFFEPADRVHTIRALDDARIDVVRLLPPGAEATTEVG